MKQTTITSFNNFVSEIENFRRDIILFRGQSDSHPLLPSIARATSRTNTIGLEKKMLEDLKRRSGLLLEKEIRTNWEWLVMAQHFGLKTRLLDWSSNPMVALWFACSNEYRLDKDSFVYVFEADKKIVIDTTIDTDPFAIRGTKILKPYLNNERIIAQNGWFTVHPYSGKSKKFVKLESNKNLKELITQIKIPAKTKAEILKKLSRFGINSWKMFPDLSGLCKHLNWKHTLTEW